MPWRRPGHDTARIPPQPGLRAPPSTASTIAGGVTVFAGQQAARTARAVGAVSEPASAGWAVDRLRLRRGFGDLAAEGLGGGTTQCPWRGIVAQQRSLDTSAKASSGAVRQEQSEPILLKLSFPSNR